MSIHAYSVATTHSHSFIQSDGQTDRRTSGCKYGTRDKTKLQLIIQFDTEERTKNNKGIL